MKYIAKFAFTAVLTAASLIASAQIKMTQSQKLKIAEMAVNEYYVDTVNEEKLVEDAIRGMLNELDPHSSYSTPEETKDLNEPLDGNFSGIGIQFNMKNDTLYVLQTIAGGPSERVGIVAGDRIIAANDTAIAGVKMKNSDIMKRLRGPKGTKVEVTVLRRNQPEPIRFRITRDDIPLFSVDAAYMIDSKTGYIRLSRFAKTSYDEVMDAATKLKKQGMKQLIFDISDNGGGYLEIATQIANEFLDKGQLIVYTEGRRSPRHEERANGHGKFRDIDLVVVVNQYSASASEILSGAIQDWDRGVVVGRRTFGKGLVQRPFPFPDGSMIRLTISRYYTPSGRCIQKPYGKNHEEYSMDIYNRYTSGELYSADSIHFSDSLKVTTLRNQRTIYGGGGIMPDIFVPLDTTEYSKYYRDIVAKGVLNQYIIDYVDKNRTAIKATYGNFNDYNAKFQISDEMLENLKANALNDSIGFNQKDFDTSKSLICDIMKALIARDIFDNADYYKVMNHRNKLVAEALAVINDKQRYKTIISSQKKQ